MDQPFIQRVQPAYAFDFSDSVGEPPLRNVRELPRISASLFPCTHLSSGSSSGNLHTGKGLIQFFYCCSLMSEMVGPLQGSLPGSNFVTAAAAL